MGLITIVSSATQGAATEVLGIESATLPAIGLSEVTSLAATVVLLYLLAYLNILEAAEAKPGVRQKVVALALPLLLTFAGIVIYNSLLALRWISPA